jgi:hypothetical protein
VLDPDSAPDISQESVCTLLVGSRCPVCGRVELRGRQTVCSARCRRARSRQRQDEARRARNAEIRELLEAALKKLEDM